MRVVDAMHSGAGYVSGYSLHCLQLGISKTIERVTALLTNVAADSNRESADHTLVSLTFHQRNALLTNA